MQVVDGGICRMTPASNRNVTVAATRDELQEEEDERRTRMAAA